jgi:hypothetical protein
MGTQTGSTSAESAFKTDDARQDGRQQQSKENGLKFQG